MILSQIFGLHSGQNTQCSNLSLSIITSVDRALPRAVDVTSAFNSLSNCEVSEINVFHCVSFFKSGYAARTNHP